MNFDLVLYKPWYLPLTFYGGGHFEIQDGGQTIGRTFCIRQFLESTPKSTLKSKFSHFLPDVNTSAIFCYISAPLEIQRREMTSPLSCV